MPLSPEDTAALKSKFGTVQQLTIGDKVLVIRKPNRLEYRRARGLINDGEMEKAIESMLPLVVYPDAAAVDAIFEDLPALETKVTDAVFSLAGLGVTVEKKSL